MGIDWKRSVAAVLILVVTSWMFIEETPKTSSATVAAGVQTYPAIEQQLQRNIPRSIPVQKAASRAVHRVKRHTTTPKRKHPLSRAPQRVPKPIRVTGNGVGALRGAASAMGWGRYINEILWIAKHESGCRVGAISHTGKYQGLGQLGPGPRRAYGQRTGDAKSEAKAMLRYIKSRYGNPARAKQFWLAHHWY